MKYINHRTEEQYIRNRDSVKKRILEVQERIKRYKKIFNEDDDIMRYNQCELKILKMRVRHLDEAQKLTRLMFSKQAKNEKA